jgi:hypothetical protein
VTGAATGLQDSSAIRAAIREHPMATSNGTERHAGTHALLDDPDFLRELVRTSLQPLLEEELTAHLGATRYERTEDRTGDRNGSKPRTLPTRVGRIEVRVPQTGTTAACPHSLRVTSGVNTPWCSASWRWMC